MDESSNILRNSSAELDFGGRKVSLGTMRQVIASNNNTRPTICVGLDKSAGEKSPTKRKSSTGVSSMELGAAAKSRCLDSESKQRFILNERDSLEKSSSSRISELVERAIEKSQRRQSEAIAYLDADTTSSSSSSRPTTLTQKVIWKEIFILFYF